MEPIAQDPDITLFERRDALADAAHVREVPIPEIPPGTAVILDNLTTQRNKEAAAALKAHGSSICRHTRQI